MLFLVKILYNSKLFAVSLIAMYSIGLIGVFALEFFGFKPCFLCIVQRITAGIGITILVCGLVVSRFFRNRQKAIFYLIILSMITVTGMHILAWYHVGVEHGVFKLASSCASKDLLLTNANDILQAFTADAPQCDRPQMLWIFSVATWTVIGTFCVLMWHAFYFIARKM
jgi:disulfide bond formation protein DsbB